MYEEKENEINNGFNIPFIAAKTLLYFMAIGSLLVVCLFAYNPYFAMKTSYDLGFEKNAYVYARTYLQREVKDKDISEFDYKGKYVNALIYSMELGEKFLNKENASNLKSDTRQYSSIKNIDKRNEMLDAYYRDCAPSMHVAVYSYENYVGVLHARACAILGDTEKEFLLNGKVLTQSKAVQTVGKLDFSFKAELFDFAVLLNQISAYEKERTSIAELSLAAEAIFNEFVQAALAYQTDDLFRLFLIRSAVEISELKNEGEWEQFVGEASLSDYYYRVLMYNYIKNHNF